MKIRYEAWKPRAAAKTIVAQADAIARDYAGQGYDLTLRQLYYQFVSRALIPNNQESYDRLGQIINKARLAGMIDWDHITDRTRNLAGGDNATWAPEDVIYNFAANADLSRWDTQEERVEVWVEKEALAGVVQRAADAWFVPYFSCRGYVSQSEMWAAGQRIGRKLRQGHPVTLLHLGDHDPSGIDMTRDIQDRLTMFIANDTYRANPGIGESSFRGIMASLPAFTVNRIALNRDQVDEYNPPPNPAKLSDSRASAYIEEHGDESWELDALDPATLDALITEHITEKIDFTAWDAKIADREDLQAQYRAVAENWNAIQEEYR